MAPTYTNSGICTVSEDQDSVIYDSGNLYPDNSTCQAEFQCQADQHMGYEIKIYFLKTSPKIFKHT